MANWAWANFNPAGAIVDGWKAGEKWAWENDIQQRRAQADKLALEDAARKLQFNAEADPLRLNVLQAQQRTAQEGADRMLSGRELFDQMQRNAMLDAQTKEALATLQYETGDPMGVGLQPSQLQDNKIATMLAHPNPQVRELGLREQLTTDAGRLKGAVTIGDWTTAALLLNRNGIRADIKEVGPGQYTVNGSPPVSHPQLMQWLGNGAAETARRAEAATAAVQKQGVDLLARQQMFAARNAPPTPEDIAAERVAKVQDFVWKAYSAPDNTKSMEELTASAQRLFGSANALGLPSSVVGAAMNVDAAIGPSANASETNDALRFSQAVNPNASPYSGARFDANPYATSQGTYQAAIQNAAQGLRQPVFTPEWEALRQRLIRGGS